MNRRAARALAPILCLWSLLALSVPGGGGAVFASTPDPAPVATNEFIPEDRNLSECVGALERPGCGSEERGGTAQTVVFVLMFAGMALIFGRIGYGIWKNRTPTVAP